MRAKIQGLLAAGLWAGPLAAGAAVIDFSSVPYGPLASYIEEGVTFTASGGGQIIAFDTPNGTRGIVGNYSSGVFPELRADIAGGAISVAVDLGDFAADPDTLFLEIFSGSSVPLGFTSLLIDSNFQGMKTLSLSAPGIAYAIFGARAPAGSGSSVLADNFTFTRAPEPGTLALLGLGLAGLGLSRRRGA